MSLSQALSTSVAGLRATQTGLALVASNIANAQTPGYVRKTLVQETTSASESGSSVRIAAINREIDTYVQRQLRVETAGGAYASLRADFYQRLQQLYGAPGSDSALETVFNKFTSAVQELAASPEAPAARSAALSSAQVLAQHLNGMTTDIQSLRSDAESGIADAVARANDAMQKIATLNAQLTNASGASAAVASWEDQRDMYVDQLSELMDVRVVVGDHKEYNVFTSSGVQLVGTQASKLAFNSQGMVTPATQWSADRSQSNLGTLELVSSTGSSIDLITNKSIRSGKIAAFLEMRDQVLVQAQDQLDALAAAMAQTLSDETVAGSAVTTGAQSGFDLDVGGLLPGNSINLTVTDHQTNRQRQITIVRVDDPAALPLKNTATLDPNDEVIGVDFSHGLASVISQLNTKLNGKVLFSNPAGTTLRVLDDGLPNLSDVTAASITRTVSGLSSGSLTMPFFVDATSPYSGALTRNGPQSLGFAGRIAVNPALIGDPSKLVLYSTTTSAGDPARPDFIYQHLATTSLAFSPRSGLGTAATPFVGTLPTLLRQVLSQQGDAASSATSLSEGQTVVVNNLKQRVADQANVNVDQEMANLMTLQTAYGANARVMSAVKDMLEYLMRM
jgi:flagellar hook-associated protein 1 FlgK